MGMGLFIHVGLKYVSKRSPAVDVAQEIMIFQLKTDF